MPKITTHALMYHDVVGPDPEASGFPGGGPRRYKLSWDRFRDHLDHVGRAVAGPPAVADDLLAAEERPPAWLLTFDDGGASATEIGAELTRRGWRGHFFVTTGLVGERAFLDAAAIRELHAMGHVIGSHSVTHPYRMSALSFEQLLDEWRASVAFLAELLGEQTRTASIPGGYYHARVAMSADRAGIRALFSSEPVRKSHLAGECLVIGRYTIRRETAAQEAASAAAGDAVRWLRQYGTWNMRKPVKAIGGEYYLRVRRALLATRGGD